MPGVSPAALAPLALASALAGGLIAAFHTYLDATGVLECPAGISAAFTAPQESLAVYVLLLMFLLGDLFHQRRYVVQGIGAVLLGIIFSGTCIQATPPSPDPTGPYTTPLDGCRKAYHPEHRPERESISLLSMRSAILSRCIADSRMLTC